MAKSIFRKTYTVNYDVSGGNTDFDIDDGAGTLLDFSKYDQIYLQVEYTGLDAATSEMTLKRKAKASAKFSDAPGGLELLKITGSFAADFDHSVAGAENFRLSLDRKTSTVGTISKIHVVAKSK